MTLELCAPCGRTDLAEIYGACVPLLWVCATRQLELGPSFAVRERETGAALFVGGFVPLADCWEAWFHAHPAGAPHMPALMRLTRLTFSVLPQSDPRPLETAVRTRAGARIARALGFAFAGSAGGIEIWRRQRWAD